MVWLPGRRNNGLRQVGNAGGRVKTRRGHRETRKRLEFTRSFSYTFKYCVQYVPAASRHCVTLSLLKGKRFNFQSEEATRNMPERPKNLETQGKWCASIRLTNRPTILTVGYFTGEDVQSTRTNTLSCNLEMSLTHALT